MPTHFPAGGWRWIGAVCAVTALAASATGSVVAAPVAGPANTGEPSITGSPIVGKDLTGDRGVWTGTSITYAYKWLRCDKSASNCQTITGATGSRYSVTSSDLGATIRFEVTASDKQGKSTATSNATAVITTGTGVPASSSPPTITGSATVGTTLNATTGSWVGDEPITYSYQWQRCDPSGNSCEAISSATKASYKLTQNQVGFTVRVKVAAKNSRGKGTAISNQTAVVTDASGGGGGGIIALPGGGKSVDVVDVPKGERLIVDKVSFSPSPIRSRSQPITVTITVKDTRGYYVRNAYVFLRSTPIVTSTPTDAQTATDGKIVYSVMPESDFPIKNGYSVQFFVKAYRKGDPSLAGISGTRLVQVPTAQ
jgi:hypothetical protein